MTNQYGKVTIRRLKQDRAETEHLAQLLADHMRKEDLREQVEMGLDPYEAVLYSILTSAECHSAWAGKKLLALFGICKGKGETYIWMLATEDVKHYKKALVACGMDFIKDSLKTYGPLCNYITLSNEPALRFIERAGAHFSEPFRTAEGADIVRFDLEV